MKGVGVHFSGANNSCPAMPDELEPSVPQTDGKEILCWRTDAAATKDHETRGNFGKVGCESTVTRG
jgi:hypothetical protein